MCPFSDACLVCYRVVRFGFALIEMIFGRLLLLDPGVNSEAEERICMHSRSIAFHPRLFFFLYFLVT